MVLEDTKENRILQQACASLAVEDVCSSEDFVWELENMANGEKKRNVASMGHKEICLIVNTAT